MRTRVDWGCEGLIFPCILDANSDPGVLKVERDGFHSLVCLEGWPVLKVSKEGDDAVEGR